MNLTVSILEPETIINHWPTIANFIIKATDTGQHERSIVDYKEGLLSGLITAWCIIDLDTKDAIGLMTTEFMVYPEYKTLHILTFTGDTEHYHLFSVIEGYAAGHDCRYIEQWGRPGWAKVLPKVVPGFEQAYVVMRKKIGEH